jgi:hypothetical protein
MRTEWADYGVDWVKIREVMGRGQLGCVGKKVRFDRCLYANGMGIS